MKLQILSENLHKKLSFVTHAISTRSQLPILLHILLETREGKLVLSATDLEIGIEIYTPAIIEENGGITVPAKIFLELITSFPQEKITLQNTNTILEIRGSKIKSKLQGMQSNEFPSLYDEKGETVGSIPAVELRKYFSRVCFAAGTDTNKPALNGVLLQKNENSFVFVATDGFRLSLQRNIHGVKEESSLQSKTIVPARSIRELLYFKGEDPITLSVSQKNNQVLFSQEDTTIISRIIEAEYPPYEKIIPSHFTTTVTFDREEMYKAVKISAIFARETANIVKLALRTDKIIVSANTPSVGDNIVEIDAALKGEENEIAFNCRYLLELFANVEEEQMVFQMTGPLNPGVFTIAEDTSFLHLIMPIRTQTT